MRKKTEVIKQEETKVVPQKPVKKTKQEKTALVKAFGLHTLRPPRGSLKKKKVKGRGSSSGHGKTSTRGSKGQTSRSGRDFYPGFEGGQTPLIRRIGKRGFVSKNRKEYQVVNIRDLDRVPDNIISLEILEENGLINDKNKLVKILGDGEVKKPLTIHAHAFSKSAVEKITKVGGKVEIVHDKRAA